MTEPHIESCIHRSARHTTHYLAAGPTDGPLLIFVHGWPELSLSWRHQLPVFAGLGFRAIAPDMRGYGQSSVYREHAAYAQSEVVADMLELLDGLGRKRAVWIGHDWGSPTVWNLKNISGRTPFQHGARRREMTRQILSEFPIPPHPGMRISNLKSRRIPSAG